ncbi:L-seryl-tRNA(Sec) selenium transferase [Clostridium magnum]|uniref:L-seryl-tRNA(Sec) selenium transferase n=1 Tax=Clostridium magnum DSM 2767 TaxID=1121326 RepID=A0A161YI73_9CLOT|nr:L-seryl-tRNA(Sec) selenium transferase [Clostridium magnum]KZL90022.1 L-seryl-tRNA(Sec) selenium transferase [Clostridium magnum DSM 2767]SHI87922.1 L-seryl-tRNA(Sec) selenium transferase [Clostridium magnum DSM 2767]
MEKKKLLRKLPKIDELLKEEEIKSELENTARALVIDALRTSIDNYRVLILNDSIENFKKEDILKDFKNIIEENKGSNFKKVINAAGVVIHTNLGRSLLAKKALENVINVSDNYNNLEYDLKKGQRGSRYSHVEELIRKVTGAEAAVVVNNNAAAVMLVLNTLCKDKEAVVSRGQLVEIGGSFRVPDVMTFSGAKLVEVGTTNRTHLYDYENNINEFTGVLLKVHTSNFKILGFTEDVSLEELVELGAKSNIPVVEDIGSGTLVDFSKYGFTYEPTVQESIKKGVDVVTFSGDKMLGGPQAGIIAGKKEYINKMKKNQLTRALRIDKMTLAALEGTLKYYLDEKEAVENIPTLYAILSDKSEHKKRAQRLKRKLQSKVKGFQFIIAEDYSMVGGGSMPVEKIETYVIRVKNDKFSPKELEKELRENKIPIIIRVANDEVIMDLRTMFDKDFDDVVDAFIILSER